LIDEAIAELQQARRDERQKGRAAMYLGACFRRRNNWRLAQRNFEEALQALPAGDEAARKEVLYQRAGEPRLRVQEHRRPARRVANPPATSLKKTEWPQKGTKRHKK
jgi:uncharacterized protein HemY